MLPLVTLSQQSVKMEAYTAAVRNVLVIYVNKCGVLPKKEQKVFVITGLFNYLSTADVKPLLNTPKFANLRNIILEKIHEFLNDAYVRVQQNHRTQAVLRELFTYLVQDDSVPLRRSQRQKQREVRHLNSCFDHCESICCMTIAADLKKWSAVKPDAAPVIVAPVAVPKPVSIKVKVKVLPRRSARLMQQSI
jgi:hypothetical protein